MSTLAYRTAALPAAGLAGVAVLSAGLIVAMSRSSYDMWGALVLGPLIVLVSYPLLVRAARRENDPALFRFLLIALCIKLAAALARYVVIYSIYGGAADATAYDRYGRLISDRFRDLWFDPGLDNIIGTGFIRLLTGVIYTVIWPTRMGGFLIYSWFAFWGTWFWYRAFRIAVPGGNRGSYARLVFFLPSMLFWPSSIGKEAWMMLSLGLAAYGGARVLMQSVRRGVLPIAIGLGMAAMVRPHMSVLMIGGITLAYAIRRSPAHAGTLGPVIKALGAVVMIGITLLFTMRAQTFFKVDSLEAEAVSEVLAATNERSGQGGSAFEGVIVSSPVEVPIAAATVLFRPLPIEVRNPLMLLTALESSFLALLALLRWRSVLHAVRNIRRIPYLTFAGAYTLAFCIAFASVGNFGIIARQRVLMLPAYLALLTAIPPRRRADAG